MAVWYMIGIGFSSGGVQLVYGSNRVYPVLLCHLVWLRQFYKFRVAIRDDHI